MAGLATFDDEAEKVAPGGATKLAAIADGEYELIIEKATIKEVKGSNVVEMKLTILTEGVHTGAEVTQSSWITNINKETNKPELNQVAVGILKKDLETLGFDIPEWTKANNRPFSQELPKALHCLTGVKFKGKKVTNGKYANLYINERLPSDGKPAKFGPTELEAAAKANDIPF